MLRPEADELLPLQLRKLLPLREALGHRLRVHLLELGLVVEGLEMQRAARHRQPNHPLGTLRQRRRREHAAEGRGRGGLRCGQGGEGRRPDSLGGPSQEGTAGERIVQTIVPHGHGLVMVSWRFKSTRATCVQAASSPRSTPAGTDASPTVASAAAAAGSAR